MNDPERWRKIDGVFAQALELALEERATFLDKACAGDAQLRQEVESLLAHDVQESFARGAVEEATQLLVNMPAPSILDKIGPYRIIRSLGAGGMGQVYLAHDDRLNRPVAIKLLVDYFEVEEERVRRFQQEALAASALNHPNILTIYEIGEFDGKSYIAAEFVEGVTLSTRLESGCLAIPECLNVALQVTGALSAAHAAGIIHRDIKPANVMVRRDGLVKVLDFGIAKYEQQHEESARRALVETVPGSVIGTAAYMSPEQARGLPVDFRSDIWSLGVVVYEMVSGQKPFVGETALDVMSAVIQHEPASFSDHQLSGAEALEPIVFKALQKDRELRYQTAAELLTDLKALQRKVDSGEAPAVRNEHLSSAVARSIPGKKVGDADAPTMISAALSETSNPVTTGKPTDKTISQGSSKTKQLAIGIVALMLLLSVAGLFYRYYSKRSLPIESIAVLPFKNESGNNEIEYLSDGMTESLINSLSQLPNLSVKSRSSVFRYKGRDVDIRRIGSELSVQAILSGRVVQRGDDLTLGLELVDPKTENVIWTEQYDRKKSDLVSLQKEIARDVAQKLKVRLSGTDEQKITKDYTTNSEAKQLYLKGHFHTFKLTSTDIQEAISYFQQAIQIDPNYALAYAGLSHANRSLVLSVELEPSVYMPRAKEAAEKALTIDEGLAEAHTSLGTTIFWYDRNWSQAESHLRRALELNSNSPDAHMGLAHLLSITGRHTEALSEIKHARELDPVSPFISALEGQFLINAGRIDEALVRLQESVALAPNFWFPHAFAAVAYIDKGMYAEAIKEARRATELSRSQSYTLALEGYALEKSGKHEEARAKLDELLKLSRDGRSIPPYHFALLYNAVGDREQTFAWLERALQGRDPKLGFLKVDSLFDGLRSDPKFQDIMRRAGF